MAQRVKVMLVCDLHDDDTAGGETVTFSLDGAGYEIDLCERHAGEMRTAFAPYVGQARRASGRGRGGGRPRGAGRGGAGGDRRRSAQVREWARAQGIEVSERGRIPASLLERYNAVH